MNIACLSLAATLLIAAAPLTTWAQASAPALTTKPTKPPAIKPAPRLLSPAEKRERAAVPDTDKPTGPVIPQVSIPLGREPAETTKPRATLPNKRKANGSVNDAAARCDAESDDAARTLCRQKLKR